MDRARATLPSPVGPLVLVASPDALVSLHARWLLAREARVGARRLDLFR